MNRKVNLNNAEKFAVAFLDEYLARGMGSLQKRDLDVLVFSLLSKDGVFGEDLNTFQAARMLQLSEARVRNLYFESQLKYDRYTDEQAVEDFVDLVSKGLFEASSGSVTFIIREPMLKQYFEEWVSNHNGFTDSSFNKQLVKVSRDLLVEILCSLIKSPEKVKELATHFMPEEQEYSLRETIQTYVEKFLLQKLDEGANDSFAYAGLLLRQMVLAA
ncbi:MAG: hypothetical protein NE334_03700 [Lentisphaeraceae bacterium]|nr:hypothetical protein [Lentisphaeraceae bacterium]